MPKGLQPKGVARRNKMLLAAVQLFLENGYEKTTTAAIARAAGMAPSSFFAAFENKEALLLTLVQQMFNRQFENAEQLLGEQKDPLMLYGIETALQMYITELSEPLRELYVMAYSLPTTCEYIYNNTAERLSVIFADYLPEAEKKDFYEMDIGSSSVMRGYMAHPCEMDIASGGITRGFMAKHCHLYFKIEDKIRRHLQCCFTLYQVPKEKQDAVIDAVLEVDLQSIAQKLIEDTIVQAHRGFEAVMTTKEGKKA